MRTQATGAEALVWSQDAIDVQLAIMEALDRQPEARKLVVEAVERYHAERIRKRQESQGQ